MSTSKSCTNCPGATDHDTAHCPLFLLRERVAFENEYRIFDLSKLDTDEYANHTLHMMWQAWQARAALAQPSPMPELERPEILYGPSTHICWTPDHTPREKRKQVVLIEAAALDAFSAQHDRIVGALQRQVSALALGAEQARVAELESQLLDASAERNAMQRQRDNERSMFERECDDADELIRLMGLDPEQFRTDGGSINLPKLRAAIAQAGQVPEVGNPKWAIGTLREAVEYLDANSLNQISSGSVLHRCMRGALDAAAPAQGE